MTNEKSKIDWLRSERSRAASCIDAVALLHWQWVSNMDWHNKTNLECLALIASEVGEAVNECRGAFPTDEFAEELADIVLRVFDLAVDNNISIGSAIFAKIDKNVERGTRGREK